jgi:hypothetical protein
MASIAVTLDKGRTAARRPYRLGPIGPMASGHAVGERARDRDVIASRESEPMIMRDEHLVPNAEAANGSSPNPLQRDHATARPPTVRRRAEWSAAWTADGEAARFSRALADRVRQSLAQEQVLQTITERLDAGASEAVHRVLHTRLSPALYDALHSEHRDAAVATATNLLHDRLVEAVEQAVLAALRERVSGVLRERLDPALGAAIARSGADVTLDAGAELALQLRRAVELGIRDRLRDGLRHPIRDSVSGSAHDRVAETVRFATAEPHGHDEAADDRSAAATTAVVEAAVHDSIASALSDRIRAIVTNSVYEAVGARLDEGLRAPRRVVWSPPIQDRRASAHAPAGEPNGAGDERFGEHVRPYIEAAVREELTGALRERLDAVARRAIDDTLRDRLAAAIRRAIADQQRWDGIDLRRLGETVRRQLIDALRARLNDALRTEAMELLRSRLDGAVQLGVARGARDA